MDQLKNYYKEMGVDEKADLCTGSRKGIKRSLTLMLDRTIKRRSRY